MPQLDLHSYLPQLTWFIVLYGTFCFIVIKVLIPVLVRKIRLVPAFVRKRRVMFIPYAGHRSTNLKKRIWKSTEVFLKVSEDFFSRNKRDFK
jgi:hypothetical protein